MEAELVMTQTRDEDGTRWRAVRLLQDGGLAIVGHDLGPGVERSLGGSEYEFERVLSAEETGTLCAHLGVGADGLLDAIAARFESTHDLEVFAESRGLAGTLWSRIGD